MDLPSLIVLAAGQAVESVSENQSVVGLLGLNWKVFVAQLINFTVVVLILWKWVFKPVTSALQERTKKIEKSLADAKKIEQQVSELQKYRQEQVTKAGNETEQILARAQALADAQKQEVLLEAQNQAEKMIAQAQARAETEKQQMVAEVKEELAGLVITAAERILREKLDQQKDMRIIKESLRNLKPGA